MGPSVVFASPRTPKVVIARRFPVNAGLLGALCCSGRLCRRKSAKSPPKWDNCTQKAINAIERAGGRPGTAAATGGRRPQKAPRRDRALAAAQSAGNRASTNS